MVVTEFKKALSKMPNYDSQGNLIISEELRKKLMHGKHDRLERFYDSVSYHLEQAQMKYMRSKGKFFKPQTISSTVYDLAVVFVSGLETMAKKMYETEAKKALAERRKQDILDMESTLQGKASGIFEEAGIIIDDSRDATVSKGISK